MSRTNLKATLISIFTYLVFFYPLLSPKITMYSGSDTTNLHYPKRQYLYESLRSGKFPFWTERIFSGFPIYADVESGYLHPLNLALTYMTGPIWSYKILHLGFYLLGSLSLYYFLKRKKFDLWGYFAANLIYFFTFFHMYHQQHFNMIWATYLLPTILLLIELFLEHKKFLYLFLNVLVFVNIFYLGSLQMLFLLFVVGVVYFAMLSFKKFAIINFIKYWALFGILFLALALPLLVPALELYKLSARQAEGTSFTEGSFLPFMFVNVFYPYLFDWGETFKGVTFNPEYFKHEIYIYVGITTLLLEVCGFVTKKKDKFDTFLLFLCGAFFVLGFIGYIPVLNKISLPGISLFRYWARSAVLYVFAIACYVGYFISNLGKKLTLDKSRLKLILGTIVFLVVLQLLHINNPVIIEVGKYFLHRFRPDGMVLVWGLLALCGVALVLLIAFRPNNYKAKLKWLACALVFVDIFFFSTNALRYAFKNVFEIYPHEKIPQELDNERIITFDNRALANRGLYFKSFSPFGYSQFSSLGYKQLFDAIGFENTRSVQRKEGVSYLMLINRLDQLGVYAVYNSVQNIVIDYDFPFAAQDVGVSSLDFNEGHLKAWVFAPEDTTLDTFVRNYPGWELFVDGAKQEFSSSDKAVFLAFDLAEGSHEIAMRFVPRAFYRGLTYSAVLISGLVILYTPKIAKPFFSKR